MNYEPNEIDWKVGDIVIHDADAKKSRMLKRVVAVMANGRYVTEYINLSDKTKWENGKEYLLDPKRFGIEVNHGVQ